MTPKKELTPTIGLEIHIELKTKSKMFCSCTNDPDETHPNVNVCPICLGHPGTLPVINENAVKKTIKTGLALNSKVSEYSKFDRKNYFYPDLPKGYQISQYDMPFCEGGFLNIGSKKIRITRIHLEEDTAKLIHPEGENYSLVDFNRAGVPLMELVTEPDMESAKEARVFAEELRLILKYLNVSNTDMEKGEMRIEANISMGKSKRSGTKVEVKNLNSFRSVERALDYEIERQRELLEEGKKVVQTTRGWDETKQETVEQRQKEEAHDYRYFPEPDLPRLHFGTPKVINEIKASIPELPQQKRERFKKEFGLKNKEIEVFVFNKDLGEYFEKVMSELRNWVKEEKRKKEVKEKEFLKLVQLAKNYILTDLQGILKGASVDGEDFLITPENFAELCSLIYTGHISSKIAKKVLSEMFLTGKDPSQIVKEKGLAQISDKEKLTEIVKKVISENQGTVKDYKEGKKEALQYLVGQIMKETKGKANPGKVNQLLEKLLK